MDKGSVCSKAHSPVKLSLQSERIFSSERKGDCPGEKKWFINLTSKSLFYGRNRIFFSFF